MASPKKIGKSLADAVKAATNKLQMLKYGLFASSQIKTRTRLGYGVSEHGAKREKLAQLQDSTIRQRGGKVSYKEGKRSVKKNKKAKAKLSELTTPSKSNLTNTAQMIDSIGVNKYRDQYASIGPSGVRDDGKTNAEVAGYATDGDLQRNRKPRPFLNLSDLETKRLQDEVRKDLTNILERQLTKLK